MDILILLCIFAARGLFPIIHIDSVMHFSGRFCVNKVKNELKQGSHFSIIHCLAKFRKQSAEFAVSGVNQQLEHEVCRSNLSGQQKCGGWCWKELKWKLISLVSQTILHSMSILGKKIRKYFNYREAAKVERKCNNYYTFSRGKNYFFPKMLRIMSEASENMLCIIIFFFYFDGFPQSQFLSEKFGYINTYVGM